MIKWLNAHKQHLIIVNMDDEHLILANTWPRVSNWITKQYKNPTKYLTNKIKIKQINIVWFYYFNYYIK